MQSDRRKHSRPPQRRTVKCSLRVLNRVGCHGQRRSSPSDRRLLEVGLIALGRLRGALRLLKPACVIRSRGRGFRATVADALRATAALGNRAPARDAPVAYATLPRMRITDADRRYASDAFAKWVWVSGPQNTFEVDGTAIRALFPVEEVLPEHYDDDNGWWTCHPDTKTGDLAVLYRSGASNAAGQLPRHGPKDLCQVILATSDAFALADDPFAGEFSDKHGCRFVSLAEFSPPIGIRTLRGDTVLAAWPALRAGFVKSASPMPEDVWRRLVEIDRTRGGRSGRRRQLTAAERRDIEHQLEAWLAGHVDALEPLIGHPVELAGGPQWPLGEDHGGTLDLLLRRRDRRGNSLIVIELKADLIRRDAIAQALGYVGWLRAQPRVTQADAIVIGLEEQQQVRWVRSMLGDEIAVHHWDDVAGLPKHLRDLLDLA